MVFPKLESDADAESYYADDDSDDEPDTATPAPFNPRRPDIKLKEIFDGPTASKVALHFKRLGFKDAEKTYVKYMEQYLKKTRRDAVGCSDAPYWQNGLRFWNKKGIMGWSRHLRHTLCRNLYWDIDISNAEGTILTQLGKRWNVSVPTLEMYCAARNVLLKQVMVAIGMPEDESEISSLYHQMRHEAKKIVTAIFNGGVRNDPRLPTWIADLHKDIRSLGEYIQTNMDDVWAKAQIRAEDDRGEVYDGNPMGKAVAMMYRIHEQGCLLAMLEYAKKQGLTSHRAKTDVCVLIHDGIMIPKTKKIDTKVLICGMQESIKAKTGLDVVLDIKPMTEGVPQEELDELPEAAPDVVGTEITIVKHTAEAATKLLEKLDGKVKKSNGMLFAKLDTGIWTNIKEDVLAFMHEFTQYKLDVYSDGAGNGPPKPYSHDRGNAEKIVRTAKDKLVDTHGFYEHLIWGCAGKLVFKNGYWDGKTCSFIEKHEGVDSLVYISRKFPTRNEDEIKRVKEVLLIPILGPETGIVYIIFMHVISRTLLGLRTKMSVEITGPRSSGKDQLFNALEAAFEDYVGSFTAGLMMTSHTTGDADRDNGIFIRIERARLAVAQENKTQNDKGDATMINAELMKKAQAPYSKTTAALKAKNAVSVLITALIVMCANNMARMSDGDAYDYVLPLRFSSEFVHPERIKRQPWNKSLKPKNDKIGEIIREPAFKDALVLIILDEFKKYKDVPFEFEDPTYREALAEWRETNQMETEESRLHEYFLFTGKEEDSVPEKQVNAVAKRLNWDGPKMDRELTSILLELLQKDKLPFSLRGRQGNNGEKRPRIVRGITYEIPEY